MLVVVAGVLASTPGAPVSCDSSPSIVFERGGFATTIGLAVASPSDIWGLTPRGLTHYDGTGWRLTGLYDLGMATEADGWTAIDVVRDNVWIVGSPCLVMHAVADTWAPTRLPWDCALTDVSVTPSGDVWAVGYMSAPTGRSSLIVRGRAGDWEVVEHPQASSINAVKMLSDTYGWASASWDDNGRPGHFIEWNGRAWSRDDSLALDDPVWDMDGLDAKDFWAVGGEDWPVAVPPRQQILHFDGTSWTVSQRAEHARLHAIKMVSRDSGWAAGAGGLILKYDGKRSDLAETTSVNRQGLSAIGVVNEDESWFGGEGQLVEFRNGAFRHWGGERMYLNGGLRSISVLPDGTGWAAGGGGPLLSRRDDTWLEVEDPVLRHTAQRVLSIAPDDAWASYSSAGGTPGLAHFDGLRWVDVPTPTRFPVWEFSAVDHDDIWAVAGSEDRYGAGAGGDVLHYDGAEWRVVHTESDGTLRAIYMVNEEEGWATGASLLHFIDGAWRHEQIIAPPGAWPFASDVTFAAADRGWLLGPAWVSTFSGGAWRPTMLDLPFPQDALYAIDTDAAGNAWIVGDRSVWTLDAGGWRTVEIPDAEQIYPQEAVTS